MKQRPFQKFFYQVTQEKIIYNKVIIEDLIRLQTHSFTTNLKHFDDVLVQIEQHLAKKDIVALNPKCRPKSELPKVPAGMQVFRV